MDCVFGTDDECSPMPIYILSISPLNSDGEKTLPISNAAYIRWEVFVTLKTLQ